MNNDSAIVLSETRALAKDLSTATNIPNTLQKKPGDVLAIVMAGKELGLGPMQSIRGFDIIQGKISMSSQMIGAMVMSSPVCEYLTPVKSNATIATFRTKRQGSPDPVEMSFTIEDAKLAGLASKDNWRKNPTAMLLARAQARIGRAVYPDLLLGIYDRDSGELEDLKTQTDPSLEETKSRLRDAVSAAPNSQPQKPPAADVVEGELVAEKLGIIGEVFAEKIANAKTPAELKALLPDLKTLSADEQATLKPVFAARKAALLGVTP